MEFPDDVRLIAMGKYSMLSKERRAQVERVHTISKTIMHLANPVLQELQDQPPVEQKNLVELLKCVRNLRRARRKLVELGNHMNAIKPIAWGNTDA